MEGGIFRRTSTPRLFSFTQHDRSSQISYERGWFVSDDQYSFKHNYSHLMIGQLWGMSFSNNAMWPRTYQKRAGWSCQDWSPVDREEYFYNRVSTRKIFATVKSMSIPRYCVCCMRTRLNFLEGQGELMLKCSLDGARRKLAAEGDGGD